MSSVMTFFFLLVGHALADFAWQSEAIAVNKNPDAKTPLQKHVPWYYWMLNHSLIHGGMVALITGSLFLGVAEMVMHFLIDYRKCKGYFGIHTDQFLHFLCKVVWIFFLLGH